MSTLKGSQTEKNLLLSFAGESQARNRYNFFAGAARKEGYEKIAEIFDITADQERIHAKNFFKQLQGGEVEITGAFPAGVIGSTVDNLMLAIEGETYEYETMYPSFADVAEEEGFPAVARLFRNIAHAEKHHAKRYTELREEVESGKIFNLPEDTPWYCRKCAYIHVGKTPPAKCPACAHPQAYYQALSSAYL